MAGAEPEYDVIVIGARMAGAPTAMLLAREGRRVLLLDRDRFPSDTISTHLMHPRGMTHLARWGLLERVTALAPTWTEIDVTREGVTVRGRQPEALIRRRVANVTGDPDVTPVNLFCAPRRTVFDKLLVDAAVEAGAELVERAVAEALLSDGGRVAGVRARLPRGRELVARAKIVIGADGRHSFVAKELGLGKYREKERCTFAYYSYWTDLSLDGLPWPASFRGRLGLSTYPTSHGLIHLVVFGPDPLFKSFRRDVERNLFELVDFVNPELGRRLRDAKRADRIYGTVDQPHYFHQPYGPGWALVGDAGYNKDQCTAMGMSHAMRDVELLTNAVHAWLSGARPEGDALAEYHRVRDADGVEYYDFVAGVARMEPAPYERLLLLYALRGQQQQIDRLVGVAGDVVPVGEFYSAGNLTEIMASGTTEDAPSRDAYEERVARYRENLFA